MEKEGQQMAGTEDSSAPGPHSAEGLANVSQSVGMADDGRRGQHLNSLAMAYAGKGPSCNMQGITEEVESITQKDEKLFGRVEQGAKQSVVKGSMEWGWGNDEQAEGFIAEDKETDEAILLSCVKDGESLTSDDESDSSASASTNDSTTCVYSYSPQRGGKKTIGRCLVSKYNFHKTQVVDSINLLKSMFDKDWEKPKVEKRGWRTHEKFGGERSDNVSGIGRGRATGGIPKCFTPSINELQERTTPQPSNIEDIDIDSDEGYY